MPKLEFDLNILTSVLENETFLAEGLLVPEDEDFDDSRVIAYGDSLARVHAHVRNIAKSRLQGTARDELYTFQIEEPPTMCEAMLELEPPKRTPAWTEPVALRFHYARWDYGTAMSAAYVPALRITILAEKPEILAKRVESHVRFALDRTRAAASLWKLIESQRVKELKVHTVRIEPNIKTPKQRHLAEKKAREAEAAEDQKMELTKVGTNLATATLKEAYEMEEVLERLADAIKGKKGRSILLVGPSGVGKTAAVHELVRRRARFGFGGTPFWATSGSRIIAGMGGYGMWQERCAKICREAAKTKAIIHVGNLVELMEVGKSIHNQVGVASFFRPYLVRGDVVFIAECLPEQIPVIEKQDAHLMEAFQQIQVEEPSEEKGRTILASFALANSPDKHWVIDEDALDLLDRLHRRYATYSAYPGRPLRFLANFLRDHPPDKTATPQDVCDAFSRETGLPLSIIDDSVPLHSAELREWFGTRVKGQPDAVEQVVSLLAVIKARMARPRKPLATLMFAGPTGVGKTEMAKALAEHMFGHKNRLVRFDMSEFADPVGMHRLIGGGPGSEGQLTARVREQPFCVLLLDEFEKAHPRVFDLLLQVFGEGRLTDAKGRVADFCNSVIIMTSNLGSDFARKGGMGFAEKEDVRGNARQHFVSVVRKFLRPEMYNRIDAVVPFSPLDRATVRMIAGRELALVAKRDGIQMRDVALELSEELADMAAVKGFDPLYGARPVKRAIEREVVLPLAEKLNRYSSALPLFASVEVKDSAAAVRVSTDADGAGAELQNDTEIQKTTAVANTCAQLRRRVQDFRNCHAVMEIENDIFHLERKKAKAASKKHGKKAKLVEGLGRLPGLRKLMERVAELQERVVTLEEDFLLTFYEKRDLILAEYSEEATSIEAALKAVLLEVYTRRFRNSDYVTLAVYAEDLDSLTLLAGAYFDIVSLRAGTQTIVQRLSVGHSAKSRRRVLCRGSVMDPEKFFADPIDDTVGVVMGIKGPAAFPLYSPEQGWHLIKRKGLTSKCFVHTSEAVLAEYMPPDGAERPAGIKSTERRREYNYEKGVVVDSLLDKKIMWNSNLKAVLISLIDSWLEKGVQALLSR